MSVVGPRLPDGRPYVPLPHLRPFHESRARLRCVLGGFGSGKTLAGCVEALDVAMAYAGNVVLVARRTYQELEDTTKRTFFEVTPPELIADYRKKHNEVRLVNGSVVLFRALDDPRKFASLNLGAVYIDEASEIDDEAVPLMLVGRLRLATVPWRGAWFTTNPPTIEHWLHKWFVRDRRGELFVARTRDNPYLPQEYIESLEREYGPSWAKRYLEGEWGWLVEGDPIYPDFDPSVHVREIEVDEDRPLIIGWDFGFWRPACVWAQVGRRGQLRVLRELMGSRVYLDEWADVVLAQTKLWFPGIQRVVHVGDAHHPQRSDLARDTSVHDVLRKKGIRLLARRFPWKSSVEVIAQKFRVRLRVEGGFEPAVLVHPSCQVLISGFAGGYCFARVKAGRPVKDEPYKDGYHDHLQDAFRYAAMYAWSGADTDWFGLMQSPKWQFGQVQ